MVTEVLLWLLLAVALVLLLGVLFGWALVLRDVLKLRREWWMKQEARHGRK